MDYETLTPPRWDFFPFQLLSLQGKNALVTGIHGGIGKAIARYLTAAGACVIGLGTSPASAAETYYACDVSSAEQCERIFRLILEAHSRIDILVNCAGITRDALTENMTEAQFDEVIAVNLKGVWNLTRLIGPHMQKNHGGSIVNISSVVGVYGNIGQANYAAAKAGLTGMTLTWAKEFARHGGNVRVNAVAPGYTRTKMLDAVPAEILERAAAKTLIGRLAEPEEIAGAVLFLASDMSSYVTGTTLHVNGGMRL